MCRGERPGFCDANRGSLDVVFTIFRHTGMTCDDVCLTRLMGHRLALPPPNRRTVTDRDEQWLGTLWTCRPHAVWTSGGSTSPFPPPSLHCQYGEPACQPANQSIRREAAAAPPPTLLADFVHSGQSCFLLDLGTQFVAPR